MHRSQSLAVLMVNSGRHFAGGIIIPRPHRDLPGQQTAFECAPGPAGGGLDNFGPILKISNCEVRTLL